MANIKGLKKVTADSNSVDLELIVPGTNSILLKTNNTDRWSVNSSGHLVPATSNTYTIGTTSALLSELHTRNLKSTGGTLSVETTDSNQIDLKTNGTIRFTLNSSGNLVPNANNTYAIGSTSAQISIVNALTLQGTGATLTIATSDANSIDIKTNALTRWNIDTSGNLTQDATNGGNLIFTKSAFTIRANTSDAADNKSIFISAGGGVGNNRGAAIQLYGNEVVGSDAGDCVIFSGSVAGSMVLIDASNSTGFIRFDVNANERWRMNASGQLVQNATNGGDIVMSIATGIIRQSTSDASDNQAIVLAGGGGTGDSRGASVTVHGNESSGQTGNLILRAGNSTSGQIQFYTGGSSRGFIDNAGVVNFLSTLNFTSGAATIGTTTSNQLNLSTNSTTRWSVDTSGNLSQNVTNGGDIVLNKTTGLIRQGTADASDNKTIKIAGGGDASDTRGGFVVLNGNEAADPGQSYLSAGNVSGASLFLIAPNATGLIRLQTNGSTRWSVDSNGRLVGSDDATLSGFSVLNRSNSTGEILLCGGNGVTTTDGARLQLFGHTHGTTPGNVILETSTATGAIMQINAKDSIVLNTNGTDAWKVDSSGYLQPVTDNTFYLGNSSNRPSIAWFIREVTTNAANNIAVNIGSTHASFSSTSLQVSADRAANTAYNFVACISSASGTPDNEIILRGDGTILADNGTITTPADYAEYFEVESSLGVLPIGTCVVLDDENPGMVRPAEVGEENDIIGVVRPQPKEGGSGIVGNHGLTWKNKYLKDIWGRYELDEDGNRILNPEYDPEQEYVTRENREEWHVIGLVGQVPILASEPKHPNWKKISDLSETVEMWLIK